MKHPTKIEGFNGSIEDAAKAIAQMRYDSIFKFLKAFANEFKKQSKGDKKDRRFQLANLLSIFASSLDFSADIMNRIWKLCKKYMQ